jgi:hypothetical protein
VAAQGASSSKLSARSEDVRAYDSDHVFVLTPSLSGSAEADGGLER